MEFATSGWTCMLDRTDCLSMPSRTLHRADSVQELFGAWTASSPCGLTHRVPPDLGRTCAKLVSPGSRFHFVTVKIRSTLSLDNRHVIMLPVARVKMKPVPQAFSQLTERKLWGNMKWLVMVQSDFQRTWMSASLSELMEAHICFNKWTRHKYKG